MISITTTPLLTACVRQKNSFKVLAGTPLLALKRGVKKITGVAYYKITTVPFCLSSRGEVV